MDYVSNFPILDAVPRCRCVTEEEEKQNRAMMPGEIRQPTQHPQRYL
jgi:hypothetical protein